jgi:histidine phosphotransferase ChpT
MDMTGSESSGEAVHGLAEQLARRLCHDLSGPLGALMGVLELASQEMPGSETLTVAEDTARQLAARLRLLRAAWGGDGLPPTVGDLQALAGGLPQRRITVDTSALGAERTLAPPLARVLVNVVLLAAEALPAGGRVTLADPGGTDVVVAIEGPNAAWPSGLLSTLADPDAAVAALESPRHLQAPLTALTARAGGVRLSLLHGGPPGAVSPLLISA